MLQYLDEGPYQPYFWKGWGIDHDEGDETVVDGAYLVLSSFLTDPLTYRVGSQSGPLKERSQRLLRLLQRYSRGCIESQG